MARKNLLTGLTEKKLTAVNSDEVAAPKAPPLAFSGRGAFGAVTRTIDALAVRADAARDLEARLAAGETITELDTKAIDRSFITDRMQSDDESYRLLRAAIEAEGQASPILVRPHPTAEGRYQVAFGHRRLRVASELGRNVRKGETVHLLLTSGEGNARSMFPDCPGLSHREILYTIPSLEASSSPSFGPFAHRSSAVVLVGRFTYDASR